MPSRLVTLVGLALGVAAAALPVESQSETWYPVSVESREPPFNPQGSFTRVDYAPGRGASRPWRLCASIPDLGLPYLRAVAHGIEAEARRQGVQLRLEDVGGFDADRQRERIEACLADGADALLVVPAGETALEPALVRALDLGVKVVDVATGSGGRNVTARVAADGVGIGQAAGSYLVDRHPLGSDTARVAWFPGPADARFAHEYDLGFRDAVRGGAITIAPGTFTPLDEAVLRDTVREVLGDADDLDAFAGVGAAVLMAMDELGERTAQVELVSTNINPAIVSAIESERIAAAVNSKPVVEGRIAVDLAVRALEGRPFLAEIRPTLEIVDRSNVATFDRTTVLAPGN